MSSQGSTQTHRASWIFMRAYLLVVALVVATGWLLEKTLEQRDIRALEQRELTLIQGHFLYLEEIARSGGALPDAAALETQLQLPALWLPADDFAGLGAEQVQALQQRVLILYNGDGRPVFYRQLAGSDRVLALGPPPAATAGGENWVVPLFFGLIAVAVFLWVRPLSQDLDRLQRAAQAFGEQQFDRRVAIGNGSWLAPLGSAFNGMAQRIQWLLQSHRELTHAVSHELRTPLARLRFSLEMLEQADAPASARHRASMNRDIEELNALVEEMLHYAELDQDNLVAKLEPVELGPWVELYLADYGPVRAGLELSLKRCPANGSVLLDTRLIKRALDNLVGNAQRFARSEIQLLAGVKEGRCRIVVRDDGPGIPESQRTAVRNAFTRLEPPTGAESSGFGLGLAIVGKIMALHEGVLHIDTAPGGGAEMILDWPLHRAGEQI